MALDEKDVRGVLSDPVLRRMDFWVDNIHVLGSSYTKIADLIEDEQILVVPGTDPLNAQYDDASDTLTTQKVDPPPNLLNRATLIHECTHAVADMDFASVTWLTNEAAARIAQATYLLLSNPNPPIPNNIRYFYSGAIALAKKFKLDTEPQAGTVLSWNDIGPLIRQIHTEPAYHENGKTSVTNGISKKDHKKIKFPKGAVFAPEPETKVRGSVKEAYKVPHDALFDFGKHNIKPEAEPALREAADYITQYKDPGNPGFRVHITGHTDSKGDPAHNKVLSKQRAEAVSLWLIAHKFVDAADVTTHGEGASQPLAPNKRPDGSDDPVGRARNRRVEVLVKL
jgi:outer membrane protein OmpA-like peptidoglycan-associated protein